jgi:tetratricopeptide (TPR) repeat protein
MQTYRLLKRWSLSVCAVLAVLSALVMSEEALAAVTDLQKTYVEHRRKPAHTQVVLFFKGARPKKISASSTPDEYVISFQHLTTRLKLEEIVQNPASTVRAIVVSPGTGNEAKIHIQYRNPDSMTKALVLPATPPRAGFYRLALNVFPPVAPAAKTEAAAPVAPAPAVPVAPPPAVAPSAAPAAATAAPPALVPAAPALPPAAPSAGPPASPPVPTKVEEQPPIEYSATLTKEEEGLRANYSEALQTANRAYDQGNFQQAYELYEQFIDAAPPKKNELAAARYGLADSYFALHEAQAADQAVEILTHYLVALKSDPAASQAPWAMYRCGLAYESLGDMKRAGESLEQVVLQHPKHPAAPLALLGLGRKHMQQKSYADAVQAFRKALRYPLDDTMKVQTYTRLGEALYQLGEQPQAVEAISKAMDLDPELYLKEPVALKYMGEAFFVGQEYDKSREYLFWYLNLNPASQDRDLVLARIAEILTLQDEKELANKLYAYIQNTFPNSEGDVIAKIRRAEYLESRDKITADEAMSIYRELLQKPLPPPLSRLIHFKFALRMFERGNFSDCLQALDDTLQNASMKATNDDLLALKAKAILGWARQSYQKKDYAQLVQLYEDHTSVFSAANSVELETMVADSYAQLKLFANAIALTQQILAKKGLPKDEAQILKMAEYYLLSGDPASASQWTDQVQSPALSIEKNKLVARILFAQQQYQKVLEVLNRLPEKDKDPAGAVNWCDLHAQSYMHTGDSEKAVAWFDKALQAVGNDPARIDERLWILINQQACYTKLKNIDKAIANMEAASSLAESEDLQCQLNYELSKLYQEAGQTEKAIQILTKMLESSRGMWQAAARQRLDYLRLKQAEKANQ